MIYTEAFNRGLLPDPTVNVSEWADANRVLPKQGSNEAGPWRTARVPYMRKVMDVLSPHHPAKKVVLVKPRQIAGTEAAINALLCWACSASGPIHYMHSTGNTAKKLSRQRLQPSIDASPICKELFVEPRSRESGNTLLLKEFIGGMLMLSGSNSANEARSMPVRYMILDEVSSYPGNVNDEGDIIEIAEAATSTYEYNKKIFLLSTPGNYGECRITKEYELSNQQEYYVPCPFCHHKQTLKWAGIVWRKDKDGKHLLNKGIFYKCESCGKEIEEHNKTYMLENGEWIIGNPESEIEGFAINALYAPLGFMSWRSCVEKFLKSKDDTEQLKVWTNQVEAKAFEPAFITLDPLALYERREHYQAKVPQWCHILTAGVDVQKDRLEMTTVGWGLGYKGWVIEHLTLMGDPIYPDVWQSLDDHLNKSYKDQHGNTLNIIVAMIDSGGHHQQQVYEFVRPRQARNVWAIKGSSNAGAPAWKRSKNPNDMGIQLIFLGGDVLKDELFARIELGEMHFPDTLDITYFEELCSESKQLQKKLGQEYFHYVKKPGRRNERLDCLQYALGGIRMLQPVWETFKEDEITTDKIEAVVETPAPQVVSRLQHVRPKHQQQEQQYVRPRQQRNFATEW